MTRRGRPARAARLGGRGPARGNSGRHRPRQPPERRGVPTSARRTWENAHNPCTPRRAAACADGVTARSPGCARGHPPRAHHGAMRVRGAGLVAVTMLAGVALVAAACGNAGSTVSNAGNGNGVTATSITVGSMASLTGPVPADFAGVVQGVQAYLDVVNASGGVYGRKILLPQGDILDDASDPSVDTLKAHVLVEQDHVFAIVGVGVY